MAWKRCDIEVVYSNLFIELRNDYHFLDNMCNLRMKKIIIDFLENLDYNDSDSETESEDSDSVFNGDEEEEN